MNTPRCFQTALYLTAFLFGSTGLCGDEMKKAKSAEANYVFDNGWKVVAAPQKP